MTFWRKANRDQPLHGTPAVRRQKTYQSQSGWVYLYCYLGFRQTGQGAEYVFEVTADRETYGRVSVLLPDDAAAQWEAAHGRDLHANQRYGLAKMALFRAFDERAGPEELRREVVLSAVDVEELAETLDL
ncbi:MAG: hypothetical protein HYZ57_16860 [Acidobacteria bacterium]|nr:hypothetical protein [Acidobacteriota bacterium]MBI3281502.1 hypothetical protein [Acidobacteriota bacterium]